MCLSVCERQRERERGFTKSENHKKSKKSKKVKLKGVFSIEMERVPYHVSSIADDRVGFL